MKFTHVVVSREGGVCSRHRSEAAALAYVSRHSGRSKRFAACGPRVIPCPAKVPNIGETVEVSP